MSFPPLIQIALILASSIGITLLAFAFLVWRDRSLWFPDSSDKPQLPNPQAPDSQPPKHD